MKRARRAVQEEIVRVAALCFGEVGYRATTLDAIAARAGVSKVTLYRYVRSKEELLNLVFERTIAAFRAGLRRIVEQALPADEKLRRIVRYQVSLLASHLAFLRVFFSEEGGLPPALATRAARAKREYDRAIEGVVREGISGGRVRDLPPTLVVFALLGMCNWLHKWYRPEGRNSPEEIAEVFVALLEHGYLRAPEAQGAEAMAPALERIERRLAALESRWPPPVAGTPRRSAGLGLVRGARRGATPSAVGMPPPQAGGPITGRKGGQPCA